MHRETEKVVVTLVVMRHFSVLGGAPRACADFCDPTADSRFKVCLWPAREMYTIMRKGSLLGSSTNDKSSFVDKFGILLEILNTCRSLAIDLGKRDCFLMKPRMSTWVS